MGLATTPPHLEALLQRHWGFSALRPLQAEAVAEALAGCDGLVILPTGGGKSLCYQLPALAQPGLTVVVSPLLSLIQDQVDALRLMGIPAASLTSAQDAASRAEIRTQVREGQLRLLYVAPEGLVGAEGEVPGGLFDLLSDVPLAAFAIDEAHCISQWGHEYRPAYRRLAMLRRHFPGVPLRAFTATATEAVRSDILTILGMREPRTLVGDFDRPNLVYRALPRTDAEAQVREVLDAHAGEAGIIYCISKKEVDALAASLARAGYRVRPYHAGLDAEVRSRNQAAFSREEVDVIVATVAFGMGIDRSNVRFVLHTGLPKSLEAYQQEAGRAGRDGLAADCTLLYGAGDAVVWRSLQRELHGAAAQSANERLEAMLRYARTVACRHRLLVEYFGQAYDRPSCNACDVCLGELRLVDDPSTLIGPLLAGVAALRGRFGAAHVAGVLRGASSKRARELGHDRLPVFGSMASHAQRDLSMWLGQLADQGLLERVGEYQVLRLAPEGESWLRGEHAPALRLTHAGPARTRRGRSAGGSAEQRIFERLRSWRKEVAAARGVPSFMVLGDAALMELVERRPASLEGLLAVKGIGERKAQDLGTSLLEALAQACVSEGLSVTGGAGREPAPAPAPKPSPRPSGAVSQTVEDTCRLLEAGQAPAQIAASRGLAVSTVTGHLEDAVTQGRLGLDAVMAAPECARFDAAAALLGPECARDTLAALLPIETTHAAMAWYLAARARGREAGPPVAPDLAARIQAMLAAARAPERQGLARRLTLTLPAPEPALRCLAAHALGGLVGPEIEPALLARFDLEDDPVVRQAVLRALGACGGAETLSRVRPMVEDEAQPPAWRALARRVVRQVEAAARTVDGGHPEAPF